MFEVWPTAPGTGAGVRGDDERDHQAFGATQVAQPPVLGESTQDHDGPQRRKQRDKLMQVTQGLGAVGGSRVEILPSGRDLPGNGVPVDVGVPRQPSGAGQPPESRGGLIVVVGADEPAAMLDCGSRAR